MRGARVAGLRGSGPASAAVRRARRNAVGFKWCVVTVVTVWAVCGLARGARAPGAA